jgi:MoaA/NifB/PqqE/SkfB family radical SAM enzyme
MCLRNVNGGKANPMLPLRDLKLDEVRRILPPDLVAQLKRIYLCGNYGDPMMARDTLAVFRYFREAQPDIRLEMMTNGSGRTPDWWESLARLEVGVRFGIDGSDQTSAIYRRNTDFSLVLRNAEAFIGAGGKAHWDFIVFRHNEHQVEDARGLSEKMGFVSFRAKRTGRFFSNQKSRFKEKHEVWNEKGEVEYYLEKPENPSFLNPSLERETLLQEKYGSFQAYLDKTAVDCKVQEEGSIYVSAEGYVFPCCWTAIQLYPWYAEAKGTEIWRLLDSLPGGLESISALKLPVREILAGEFFRKLIPERWTRPSIAAGKLKVCARICGKEFDPFRDQFSR